MVPTSDQIGRLAEVLATAEFSRAVGGPFGRPLFRVTSLGDKYPAADFLVDVLDAKDFALGYFFVQVKGTATERRAFPRLPVSVSADRFNRLVRLPAPTYLVGVNVPVEGAVDLEGGVSFLVGANRPRKSGVSSITKAYSLRQDAVMIQLYREVLDFWQVFRPALQRTRFTDV